eukprot:1326422-Pleurochrysis_carterae.AAC.1
MVWRWSGDGVGMLRNPCEDVVWMLWRRGDGVVEMLCGCCGDVVEMLWRLCDCRAAEVEVWCADVVEMPRTDGDVAMILPAARAVSAYGVASCRLCGDCV